MENVIIKIFLNNNFLLNLLIIFKNLVSLSNGTFFKTKICPYFLTNSCTKNEKCIYAHS